MNSIICSHCGEPVKLSDGLLDSGMVVHCPYCDKDTIIDLFKPGDRDKLYDRLVYPIKPSS